MNKIAKICFGLGFASIAFSAYVYQASGIADATYVGLWVPSFFLSVTSLIATHDGRGTSD